MSLNNVESSSGALVATGTDGEAVSKKIESGYVEYHTDDDIFNDGSTIDHFSFNNTLDNYVGMGTTIVSNAYEFEEFKGKQCVKAGHTTASYLSFGVYDFSTPFTLAFDIVDGGNGSFQNGQSSSAYASIGIDRGQIKLTRSNDTDSNHGDVCFYHPMTNPVDEWKHNIVSVDFPNFSIYIDGVLELSGIMPLNTEISNYDFGIGDIGNWNNETRIMRLANFVRLNRMVTENEALILADKPIIAKKFTSIKNITGKFEFANISESTVADTLETTEKIEDGNNLVIVKDDDSIHEIVASGVTGTGPYQLDTTTTTQGELPSKAYRVDENIEFNGTSVNTSGNVYSGTDPLLSTRTFTNKTLVPTGTVETKVNMSATGNKMIELKADIYRESV